MDKTIPDVRIVTGDSVTTLDGKTHKIARMEYPINETYTIMYLDEVGKEEDGYRIERLSLDHYAVDSVAQYFTRVGNYFICTAESQDCSQVLHDIQSALRKKIKGIDTTISAHLDSDDMNIDIIFLKKLYAEAKGLREAREIVEKEIDKLERNQTDGERN